MTNYYMKTFVTTIKTALISAVPKVLLLMACYLSLEAPPLHASLFGRCGTEGEGSVFVVNETRTTKFIKANGVRPGTGYYEQELGPGESFRSSICNYDDIASVEVYTQEKCGKTFLGKSKGVRVYKKETFRVRHDSFKLDTNEVLDPLARVAGFAVTAIAESYGVPPEILAELGVNEASLIAKCSSASESLINAGSCLYELYEWMPKPWQNVINEDQCLSSIYEAGESDSFQEERKQIDQMINDIYHNVYSREPNETELAQGDSNSRVEAPMRQWKPW